MLDGNPLFLSLRSKPLSGFVDIILFRSRCSAARRVVGLPPRYAQHRRASGTPGSRLNTFTTEARRNSAGYLSSCNFDERKSLYRDMEGRFWANARLSGFPSIGETS